jgi:exopolyphosphatase/guanosine-5'-triphosphate,3'-diphosphate pyrophosphatase
MKRASIDIGSNSILLLVAEYDVDKGIIEKEYLNESFITSLGKDLDKTKVFHPDSMKASLEALAECKKLLQTINFKPENVIVTATEASRVAKNSREFYEAVKNDIGFNVSIISSKGEAYYTALGVVSSMDSTHTNITVMDIGGASTELIQLETSPFKINGSISLPVGSVRATDWRAEGVFEEKIASLLAQNFKDYETKTLVCVAGSMTALASMFLGQKEYSAEKIEGMSIAFKSFKEFSTDLQATNLENLKLLFPFLGKRAPMVASGALVAELIAEKLGVETIKISTRGLRYGTITSGGVDEQFIG